MRFAKLSDDIVFDAVWPYRRVPMKVTVSKVCQTLIFIFFIFVSSSICYLMLHALFL